MKNNTLCLLAASPFAVIDPATNTQRFYRVRLIP
jgi:hypothetical protein